MSLNKKGIKNIIGYISSKTPLIAIYGGIIFISIWIGADIFGLYNSFDLTFPLGSGDFAKILGAMGTVIFTFALAMLYQRQTGIQKQQEGWMKADHTPVVWIDKWNGPRNKLTFDIVNHGNGVAQDIEAKILISPQKNSWLSDSIELAADLKSRHGRLLPPNTTTPLEFSGNPTANLEKNGVIDVNFAEVIEIVKKEWDTKKIDATIFLQYEYINGKEEERMVVWNAEVNLEENESLEDILVDPEKLKENDFGVQPEVDK